MAQEAPSPPSLLRTHIVAAMAAGNTNVTDALLEPLRESPITELVREMRPELTAAHSKTAPIALFMLSQAAIKRNTIYKITKDNNDNGYNNNSEVADSMLVLFQFFTSKIGHFTTLDAAVEAIARVFEWWVTGRNSIDDNLTSKNKDPDDINKVSKIDSSVANVYNRDHTVDTVEDVIDKEQVAIRRSLIIPSYHPFLQDEETEKKKMMIIRELIKNVFGRIQLQSMFGKSKAAAMRLLEIIIGVCTDDTNGCNIAMTDALRLTLGLTNYDNTNEGQTSTVVPQSALSVSDFMSAFLTATDGEREPELVLKVFRMTQKILTSSVHNVDDNPEMGASKDTGEIDKNINNNVEYVHVPLLPLIPADELEPYIEDLFLNVSSYFPVLFSPPPFSSVSRDDIRSACHCLLGCPLLAKYTIPFLCDKVTSPAATTKKDSIELLHDIVKVTCSEGGVHGRQYSPKEMKSYLFSIFTTIRLEMTKLVIVTNEGLMDEAYITILKELLALISSLGELVVALGAFIEKGMEVCGRSDNSHSSNVSTSEGGCKGAIHSPVELLRMCLPVLLTVLRMETIERLKSGHNCDNNQNGRQESLPNISDGVISSKVDALIINALAKSSNVLCAALANVILTDFSELLRPSLSSLPSTSESIDLAMLEIADVKKLDKLITTLASLFSAIETRKVVSDDVSGTLQTHIMHTDTHELEKSVDIIMYVIFMVFTGITCPSSATHLIPLCGEVIATYIAIHDIIHYHSHLSDEETVKERNSMRKEYLFQLLVKRLLSASQSELDDDGARVIMMAISNAGRVEREALVTGLFFAPSWAVSSVNIRVSSPSLSIFPSELLLVRVEEAQTKNDEGSTYFLHEFSCEERLPALLETLVNKIRFNDVISSNVVNHSTCTSSSQQSLIILERLLLSFHGMRRCTASGCVSMSLDHNANSRDGGIIMCAVNTLGLDTLINDSYIHNNKNQCSAGSYSLVGDLMRIVSELLTTTFLQIQKKRKEVTNCQLTSSESLLFVILKKIFSIIHPINNNLTSNQASNSAGGSLLQLLEHSPYGPDIVASLLGILKELSVTVSPNSTSNVGSINNSNCDDIIRVCLDNWGSSSEGGGGLLLWACGMEVASIELLDTYSVEVKTKWFEMALNEFTKSSSSAAACRNDCVLRAIAAMANKCHSKIDFNNILQIFFSRRKQMKQSSSSERLTHQNHLCSHLPPTVLAAICMGSVARGAPVLEAFEPLLRALCQCVTEPSSSEGTVQQYYSKNESEVIAGFAEVFKDRVWCPHMVLSKFWIQRSFCEITRHLFRLGTVGGDEIRTLLWPEIEGEPVYYYNYLRLRLRAIMCCNKIISTVSSTILQPMVSNIISQLENAIVTFPTIPIGLEGVTDVQQPHCAPNQRPYPNHSIAMADVLAISAAAVKGIMIIAVKEPLDNISVSITSMRKTAVEALLRVNNRCYDSTVTMEKVVNSVSAEKDDQCEGKNVYHINIGHHLVSSIQQESRTLMRRLMSKALDFRGAPNTFSPLTLLSRGLLFEALHINNTEDSGLTVPFSTTDYPTVSNYYCPLSAVFNVDTLWPPLLYRPCPTSSNLVKQNNITTHNTHVIHIEDKLVVIDAFKAIIHTVLYMSNDGSDSVSVDGARKDVSRHNSNNNDNREHLLELCKNEKSKVLRLMEELLGDRKRLVRTAAAKCRHEWFKLK